MERWEGAGAASRLSPWRRGAWLAQFVVQVGCFAGEARGLVDGVGDVEVAPGGDGHPAVACIAGARPHRAVVVVRAAAVPDHVHIMLV